MGQSRTASRLIKQGKTDETTQKQCKELDKILLCADSRRRCARTEPGNVITAKQIKEAPNELNNHPRRRHNFLTPNEFKQQNFKQIDTLALAIEISLSCL
jgi:hypothetical protein